MREPPVKWIKDAYSFAKFAWFTLAYNIFVILMGAFVRATGSGAGCGAHWPLCNGVVIPKSAQIETIIEFSHRATSGLSMLLILFLVAAAFKLFPKGNPVRTTATLSLVFILIEAVVGAGLVMFGLVEDNDSTARAIVIVIHLVNTYLLLGSIALTARWASAGLPENAHLPIVYAAGMLIGILGMLAVGASGAITALGDTLFPAGSLVEGLQQDLDETAHFILQLRIYHPILAVSLAVYLAMVISFLRKRHSEPVIQNLSQLLLIFIGIQIGLGFVNVLLLAPVWMQLVHLLAADLVWITFILTAESFWGGRVAIQGFPNRSI